MILDILIDTLLVSSINLDICLGVGISLILFNMLLNFPLLFKSSFTPKFYNWEYAINFSVIPILF
jgi:hypothetical protein